ncbi:ABC transporter, ATP-binding protein [Bacillus sp. JCM 19046]|nr:ABC transporter, ATP-binding protein [Bacillus sp. JCM 19045]GAF19150.1 ABC transporter, ATP-binding protein [Bacillus sp. JCM 19046]
MNTLKVTGLKKKYGSNDVFTDLSVHLQQNRFVVLLGANGSGKSTFLRLCAGLAPQSAGSIELNDAEERMNRAQLSSYVSEKAAFGFNDTAEAILKSQSEISPDFHLNKAIEFCDVVAVPMQTKWNVMSTGQRYLLSLIIAIAEQRPFIFIDEVLANLDTSKKEAMRSILTDFLVEEDRFILMATHAYEDVEALADGVIFIENKQATIINDLDKWRFEHGKSLKDLFAEVGKR